MKKVFLRFFDNVGDNKTVILLVILILLALHMMISSFTDSGNIIMMQGTALGILILASIVVEIKERQKKDLNAIRCDFDSYKQSSIDEIESKKNQLNWEGQNNVLTDMFRQAKNKGYLTNSLPDIAIFLKDNFSCFANTKLSTIESQLKNNNSSANAIPKEEKRIKIDN